MANDYSGSTIEDLKKLLGFKYSKAHKNMLILEVTQQEVRNVLFAIPGNKSHGPYGYTSELFKEAWAIIGKYFTVGVQSFFLKGFLPEGIYSTILALIPKKGAKKMKDYRLISCCNVIYKVISIIIDNRLKVILPSFIASNQSAFVKDILLIENVFIATELVKNYQHEAISLRWAMKIDKSKAFDSVQWEFFLNTFAAVNFSE